LSCTYATNTGLVHWPTFNYCRVDNQNFPLSDKNKIFSFSGSASQKKETTVVFFQLSPSLEFIPLQIFNEFPNLNGILIERSNIPILKKGFFTKKFKTIQYLDLYYNKMQQIEQEAFINLPELKWINLGWNQIESMKINLFKNNIKLEYVGF
jgi:hypothetical protein